MENILVKDLYRNIDKYDQENIKVSGWIRTLRDSKTFGFIELNDGSFFNNVQIVFDNTLKNFEEIRKLSISSTIEVKGKFIKTENAKQPFEIKATEINIVNVDSTPPKCSLKTSGTMGDNSWYTSSVTVSFKSKSDEISGVAKSGIGRSSSYTFGSNSLTQSSDTGGVTYGGIVKDNAGNESTCSTSFKKDSTPPTCSSSKGNTWTTAGVSISYSCGDNLSGVAICPANKSGVKGSVGAETVKDNAGNTASCPGQTVSKQTQYRTRTRSVRTCTTSCCGRYQSGSYVCGCAQYRCRYCFIGETQGAGGMCKYTYGSSCAGSLGSDYPLLGKTCSKNRYCAIYANRTCTDAGCCGYNPWSGWSAWGSGYWCSSSTCQSQSRDLYY